MVYKVTTEKGEMLNMNNYACTTVYGDSVTGDTPLILKDTNGTIHIRTIETFEEGWIEYPQFKSDHTGLSEKQQIQPTQDWFVWTRGKKSEKGDWAKIKRFIRHKTDKQLYRVLTHTGCIDVTEDHSLLNSKGEKVKPKDVKIGDTLYHSYPEFDDNTVHLNDIVDALKNPLKLKTLQEKEAFVYGFFFADGSCGKYDTKSGIKYTWAINNQNKEWLENCQKILTELYGDRTSFVILETMESSGVYKLVPKGSIKFMVDRCRPLFYDKNKYKTVPNEIINGSVSIKKAFFAGYYAGDGDKCENTNCK